MTPVQRFLLAYVTYVGGVHAIDGPWKHWSKGRMVDMWTLTHVAWSVAARLMGIPLPTLMKLAVANEGAEFLVRRIRPDALWGTPEDAANVATDLIANYIGYVSVPDTLVNQVRQASIQVPQAGG